MDLAAIRTDARYAISPQLTSTEYSDAALDRNANNWYKKALGWAVAEQGDWQIAGETIFRNTTTGVSEYALPTSLIRIYKGEMLYTTGGVYVPLTFQDITPNQAAVEGNATRTFDDVTRPTADLEGANIIVKPAPTEDVVNGIRLSAQLTFDDLADATDEPMLMDIFHRVLAKGAAMDYAQAEEMWTKFRELKYEIFGDPRVTEDLGIRGEMIAVYSVRSAARRDGLSARRRSYR